MINEFYKEKTLLKKREEMEELKTKYKRIILEWIDDCKNEWITDFQISQQLYNKGINMPPSRISDLRRKKDSIWIDILQNVIDFIFNKKKNETHN